MCLRSHALIRAGGLYCAREAAMRNGNPSQQFRYEHYDPRP